MKRSVTAVVFGAGATVIAAVWAADPTYLEKTFPKKPKAPASVSGGVVQTGGITQTNFSTMSGGTPVSGTEQTLVLAAPNTLTGFQKKGPGVTGAKLGLKPGETATQKALEYQEELDAAKQREDELRRKVAQLEDDIQQKNARLTEAIREMNATRQELVAVRSQLERWAQNMTDLREKIRSAEADNLATMQTIISLLQQFLQVESDMKDRSRETLNLEKLFEREGRGNKGDK